MNASLDLRTATLRSGRLAWAVAAAAAAGSLTALAWGIGLALIHGVPIGYPSHVTLALILTVVYALVGGMMAARLQHNPIGWIFLAVAVLHALTSLTDTHRNYAAFVGPELSVPGAELAAWLNLWVWMPAVFLPTVFLFLLFPSGTLLGRSWHTVFWLGAVGLAVSMTAVALHPGPIPTWDTGHNPYGRPELTPALDVAVQLGFWLLMVAMVGSMASFAVRFKHAEARERQQLKWLGYALCFMALLLAGGAAFRFLYPDHPLVTELSMALFSLIIIGIGGATGMAILRDRLYNIDVIIRRTLLYGTLTVAVVLIYVVLVGGLGMVFQTHGSPLIALLATGAVAVLFQPLRERLQTAVNRLFYGDRDVPMMALSRLGNRLEAAVAPADVLPALVETIADTLKLPYVAVSLGVGDDQSVAAEFGRRQGSPIGFPLTYQGERLGKLLVAQRAGDEPLNQADLLLLENIAHQAGPAVHNVRLTSDLQRSRLELVTAREEERRRLRRDLHDGLGATLAALNLQTGALRRAIERKPAEATALADELKDGLRGAIDDIRRLVYELRPPTLDQLGLIAAVAAHAAACSRGSVNQNHGGESRLQVRVEAPDHLPPLPAAVEVAAFRVVQEALTNVVRHARARSCVVRLALDDSLTVEVIDDGIGLSAADQNGGVGLVSMRERAAELGGTCIVENLPSGGTRVAASFPVEERSGHGLPVGTHR